MVGKGRKIGILILGGGLLVALVVTMVRISGPASDSTGQVGLLKREALLGEKAREILVRAVPALSRQSGSPLLGPPEIRFDGQVLRIPVSPDWNALPLTKRTEIVTRIADEYVEAWRGVMKSRREPAIVFEDGRRRVALHTRIDQWVLEGSSSGGGAGPD